MHVLVNVQKQVFIKIFTADELKALADLYKNPAGKSALKKMKLYEEHISTMLKTEFEKVKIKAPPVSIPVETKK
jgi:hypothetical protein